MASSYSYRTLEYTGNFCACGAEKVRDVHKGVEFCAVCLGRETNLLASKREELTKWQA